MENVIKTRSGKPVGEWDGHSIHDLQAEIVRIQSDTTSTEKSDKLVVVGIPHRNQMPADLLEFNAYPIWGCDKNQNCLCGAKANRIVSVEDVRQYSMIDHH